MTPVRCDFIPDTFTNKDSSVQQLSGKTSVKRFGPVHWRFKLPDTTEYDILPITHYIPFAGIRLFSSQAYFKLCKGGLLILDDEVCNFTLPTSIYVSVPCQSSSNLPLLYRVPTDPSLVERSSLSLFTFQSLTSDSIHSSIIDETNQNIPPNQMDISI